MVAEAVNEFHAEDKVVELWSDFPGRLYISSPDSKNVDKRQQALEFLAENMDQNGMLHSSKNSSFCLPVVFITVCHFGKDSHMGHVMYCSCGFAPKYSDMYR